MASPVLAWLRRIFLVAAVAGILYAGYNFYQNAYYGDHIPSGADLLAALRRVWNRLTIEQVAQIIRSDTFRRHLPYRIRLLIFVTAIWSVYFAAGVILIYEALRKIYTDLRPLGSRSRYYRPVRAVTLSLAAVGTVCILYGFYVEPYWLEVTHVPLTTKKFAPGTGPVRIALISDLHCARKARLEDRLPGVIEEQKPDLILFAGDSLNSSRALDRFQELMRRLRKIAPTYAVQGNWDKEYWDNTDLYANTGVRELKSEAVTLKIKGAEVWLSGAGWADWDPRRSILKQTPANVFSIFLHHDPDHLDETTPQGVDLYLAGHTHGGQIALPFYGALVTYSEFDKKYESGLYREGPTTMYVNRGIGMARWPQPEARFCARPEVTIVEIAAAPR